MRLLFVCATRYVLLFLSELISRQWPSSLAIMLPARLRYTKFTARIVKKDAKRPLMATKPLLEVTWGHNEQGSRYCQAAVEPWTPDQSSDSRLLHTIVLRRRQASGLKGPPPVTLEPSHYQSRSSNTYCQYSRPLEALRIIVAISVVCLHMLRQSRVLLFVHLPLYQILRCSTTRKNPVDPCQIAAQPLRTSSPSSAPKVLLLSFIFERSRPPPLIKTRKSRLGQGIRLRKRSLVVRRTVLNL